MVRLSFSSCLLCLWSLAVLRSLEWEASGPLPARLWCQQWLYHPSLISLPDAALVESQGSAPSHFLLVFWAITAFSTSDLLS